MLVDSLLCQHTISSFFFFNDTATTEIYTLSLHDALPISSNEKIDGHGGPRENHKSAYPGLRQLLRVEAAAGLETRDRKSTRLNSSHSQISYAVFCLKKKKKTRNTHDSRHHCSRTVST